MRGVKKSKYSLIDIMLEETEKMDSMKVQSSTYVEGLFYLGKIFLSLETYVWLVYNCIIKRLRER